MWCPVRVVPVRFTSTVWFMTSIRRRTSYDYVRTCMFCNYDDKYYKCTFTRVARAVHDLPVLVGGYFSLSFRCVSLKLLLKIIIYGKRRLRKNARTRYYCGMTKVRFFFFLRTNCRLLNEDDITKRRPTFGGWWLAFSKRRYRVLREYADDIWSLSLGKILPASRRDEFIIIS